MQLGEVKTEEVTPLGNQKDSGQARHSLVCRERQGHRETYRGRVKERDRDREIDERVGETERDMTETKRDR